MNVHIRFPLNSPDPAVRLSSCCYIRAAVRSATVGTSGLGELLAAVSTSGLCVLLATIGTSGLCLTTGYSKEIKDWLLKHIREEYNCNFLLCQLSSLAGESTHRGCEWTGSIGSDRLGSIGSDQLGSIGSDDLAQSVRSELAHLITHSIFQWTGGDQMSCHEILWRKRLFHNNYTSKTDEPSSCLLLWLSSARNHTYSLEALNERIYKQRKCL